MKYLVLWNDTKPSTDWSNARFDFDYKKHSFKDAPMFVQDDGDLVFDAKWLIEKVDTNKYDGVIAYVKGDALKGVWGTHTKMQLGDKRFSVIQCEQHAKKFRKPEGILGNIKMVSTRKKTAYPQSEYTFNHELVHSYKYLKGLYDLLHLHIKFGNYDTYIDTVPKKKTILTSPTKLTPRLERDIKRFVRYAKYLQVPCRVTEGFRSLERQNELYKQRPRVTNAKAGESFHNYGVAFDIVPLDGYNISSRRWLVLGTIGELMGYKWGGRWTGFVDKPHMELTFHYTIEDFQENNIDWLRYN